MGVWRDVVKPVAFSALMAAGVFSCALLADEDKKWTGAKEWIVVTSIKRFIDPAYSRAHRDG